MPLRDTTGESRDPEDLEKMPLEELNDRLFVAAELGDVDLALDLLEAGADPNIKDDAGVPLLHASLNNKSAISLQLLEGLLQNDADPDQPLPVCRWTPLHKAAALGYTVSVHLRIYARVGSLVCVCGGAPVCVCARARGCVHPYTCIRFQTQRNKTCAKALLMYCAERARAALTGQSIETQTCLDARNTPYVSRVITPKGVRKDVADVWCHQRV